MGAWGINNFDNDDALDWFDYFCDKPSKELLQDAFASVLEVGDDYLEATEAANALVAAEVVASLKDSPASNLPEHIEEGLNNLNVKINDVLILNAIKSAERVKSDSELKELWEETDNFQEWNSIVDDLINRLKK